MARTRNISAIVAAHHSVPRASWTCTQIWLQRAVLDSSRQGRRARGGLHAPEGTTAKRILSCLCMGIRSGRGRAGGVTRLSGSIGAGTLSVWLCTRKLYIIFTYSSRPSPFCILCGLYPPDAIRPRLKQRRKEETVAAQEGPSNSFMRCLEERIERRRCLLR